MDIKLTSTEGSWGKKKGKRGSKKGERGLSLKSLWDSNTATRKNNVKREKFEGVGGGTEKAPKGKKWA